MGYNVIYERTLANGQTKRYEKLCYNKDAASTAVDIYTAAGYRVVDVVPTGDDRWFVVHYFMGHNKLTDIVNADSAVDAEMIVKENHNFGMYDGIIGVDVFSVEQCTKPV